MHTIAISLFVAAPALVSAAATLHKRIGGYGTYYYTQTGNAGSCGSYLSDSGFTVAMNQIQYTDSMCGQTITITANGKTAQATIMDLCPTGGGNCNYGDMDMSPGLFQIFSSLDAGKISIEWDFGGGSPPPPSPTTTEQEATYTPPPPDTTTYYQPPPPDTTSTSTEDQWTPPPDTTTSTEDQWTSPTTTWEPPPTSSTSSSSSSSSSSSNSSSSYSSSNSSSSYSSSSSSSAPATSPSADLTVQSTQQSQSTGGNLFGLGEALVNIGSMLRYAGGNGA